MPAMPDIESDHHRGGAAVARLDLVAPPAAPATTTACDDDDEEEDGFTFAAVAVAVPVVQAADCADARIGPVYPVFGRPRWSPPTEEKQRQDDDEEEEDGPGAAGAATARRMPLGRLLLEDRWCDCAPSVSGQQQHQPADAAAATATELDGVPAETYCYCLWSPGASPPASRRASPARFRKSGSTGSPPVLLRWRRRRVVVVERSHSDGKDDRFVFPGTSPDRISAGEGQDWMNTPGSDAGGKSSSTAFFRCKQDLVHLVASAVRCPRSCYLF